MNILSLYRYVRFMMRKRLPRIVVLDITGRCNAKCMFCPRAYMPDERKNGCMSVPLFEHCLKEMKKHGIDTVKLYSTGEPFLHPMFEFFIRRLSEERFHVTVSTNGSMLRRYQEVLFLVDHIQLSIDGWDKQSYELLHHPLRFDDTLRQVEEFYQYREGRKQRLMKYGMYNSNRSPRVTVNLLMTPNTNLDEFRRLWGGLVDDITVNYLTGVTRYQDGVFMTDKPDQYKQCFYPSNISYHQGCMYPFDVLTVGYDGKIAFCCEDFTSAIPLGDISEGIKNVFQSKFMEQVRRDFLSGVPTVCAGCNRFHKPVV